MKKGQKVSITQSVDSVTFLPNRRPDSPAEDKKDTFCTLSDYRDGGIFCGHYAGTSEWEKHPVGDEIVVPKNIWHHFELEKEVKVMTVTPQPTDHQIERP